MQRQQRSAKTFQYRLGLLCLCWLALNIIATAQSWPQWGGPQRNFMVEAKGLAETWPASGPKRLWSRSLGEGHSSIIVDADRLYTMYSKGAQEFVVALDRATGKTIWEKGYAAPTTGFSSRRRKMSSERRTCFTTRSRPDARFASTDSCQYPRRVKM